MGRDFSFTPGDDVKAQDLTMLAMFERSPINFAAEYQFFRIPAPIIFHRSMDRWSRRETRPPRPPPGRTASTGFQAVEGCHGAACTSSAAERSGIGRYRPYTVRCGASRSLADSRGIFSQTQFAKRLAL
jgi:hypothetical protein